MDSCGLLGQMVDGGADGGAVVHQMMLNPLLIAVVHQMLLNPLLIVNLLLLLFMFGRKMVIHRLKWHNCHNSLVKLR